MKSGKYIKQLDAVDIDGLAFQGDILLGNTEELL